MTQSQQARAELTLIIMSPEGFDGGPASCGPNEVYAARTADAILAAGYRKPRTITTVEEVAALPVDSVIAGRPLRQDSAIGNIFCVADPEAEEQAGLYVMGVDGVQSFDFIFDDLPATVLYEPQP